MTEAATDFPRTLSLVRVEAAYGPIYLVVCIDHDGPVAPDAIDHLARLTIETLGDPSDILQHVVAVIHQDRMAEPQMFTVVQTKEVAKDFDFDQLSRARGSEKWQRFFKGDWAHADTLGA